MSSTIEVTKFGTANTAWPTAVERVAWPDAFLDWHYVSGAQEIIRALDAHDAGTAPIEDPAELRRLKERNSRLKDTDLWGFYKLRDGEKRAASNVEYLTALPFDFDGEPLVAMDAIERTFGLFDHVVYTSYRHRPEVPRFRVIVRVTRNMTLTEFEQVRAALHEVLKSEGTPCAPLAAVQMYYRATRHSDAALEPRAYHVPGPLLDVDAILAVAAAMGVKPPTVDLAAAQAQVQAGLSTSIFAPTERPAVENIDYIEAQCQFMRHARDDAKTLKEPEWFAAISIYSRCVNGREITHARSRPYPRYDEAETNKYFNLRLESPGPWSCEQIHAKALNAQGKSACEGCKIGSPFGGSTTSPVHLGRPTIEAGAKPEEIAEDNRVRRVAEVAQAEAVLEQARAALAEAKDDTRAALAAKAQNKKVNASPERDQRALAQIAQAKEAETRCERAVKDAEKKLAAAQKTLAYLDDSLARGANPLVMDKLMESWSGGVTGNKANLRVIMLHDQRFQGLWYDAFAEKVYVRNAEGVYVENTDAMDTHRAADIETIYEVSEVNTRTYREVLLALAHDNEKHPVREYLRGLVWDKTPRLDKLMTEGFGAFRLDHIPEHDRYLADAGRKLAISAVARIEEPGCKVDEVLVLCGLEGLRKSRGLRELFGADWFADTSVDLKSKDSLMALAGKWGYELQELTSFERADKSAVRAFISSVCDYYRPPYAAAFRDRPRQNVLVGTTNEVYFLDDPHGARRFVPVTVQWVNLDWIIANREQLWAEAMHLFRRSRALDATAAERLAGQWWYDDSDGSKPRLLAVQELHKPEDLWRVFVEQYLLRGGTKSPGLAPNEVFAADILADEINGLKKPRHTLTNKDKNRIGRILESLGGKEYYPPVDPFKGSRPARRYVMPPEWCPKTAGPVQAINNASVFAKTPEQGPQSQGGQNLSAPGDTTSSTEKKP